MAKKSIHSRVRSIVFCLLSFVLSVLLFLMSVCAILATTVFNPQFLLKNTDSTEYYSLKCEEITEDMINLGYASGLDEEFFEGLVDAEMARNDTYNYIQSYYSGESTKLDTTTFTEMFNTALDKYIEEKNITEVNEESREYLVNRMARVYRYSLEIPFLAKLSSYFQLAKKAVPIAMTVIALLCAVICVVFFVSNSWKHRAVRYICYATSATFLTLIAIPAYMYFSDMFSKMNFATQSLYNLFVQCGNSLCTAFVIGSLLLLLVSIVLFIQYTILRKKAG